MKKNLFISAYKLFVSALLLTFIFISCKKQEAISVVSNDANSAQDRRTGFAPVNLNVTINDATGYNITSDSHGDYINGSKNVQASIDNTGNLAFNVNPASGKTTGRSLNFNFSEPITTFGTQPVTTTSTRFSLSTVASTVSSFTKFQSLAIGQTECVSFRVVAMTGSTTDWRAIFHAGLDDRTDSTTAFASVKKTGTNTWTLTSLGNCLSASVQNKAALRSGNATTLYGYYNLPFSFTLIAQ